MCNSDFYLTDNGRNRAIPGALNASPKSGVDTLLLTNAAKDTDGTVTVVPGQRYLLVPLALGGFYVGLADVTTAANVKWVIALEHPGVVVNVPIGVTTLHFATTANGGKAYLIPLA